MIFFNFLSSYDHEFLILCKCFLTGAGSGKGILTGTFSGSQISVVVRFQQLTFLFRFFLFHLYDLELCFFSFFFCSCLALSSTSFDLIVLSKCFCNFFTIFLFAFSLCLCFLFNSTKSFSYFTIKNS